MKYSVTYPNTFQRERPTQSTSPFYERVNSH